MRFGEYKREIFKKAFIISMRVKLVLTRWYVRVSEGVSVLVRTCEDFRNVSKC